MSHVIHYRLAAGVDVIPLQDDSVLFRSNTLGVTIEGSMAVLLGRRILPLLRQPRSLEELTHHLAEVPPGELQAGLDALVDAHVLERTEDSGPPGTDHPFAAFLTVMGVDRGEASRRMLASRVAVFGLEAHGAHLALELGRLGIGACVLADPFPVAGTDALLMPAMTTREACSRQDAVAALLAVHAPAVQVALAGALSRDSVAALAGESTLLISCFDHGFETAHHWVNRAAIATQTPALFAHIRTHVLTLGPHVVPGQSACYMCYRMRRIACEENYDEAMAYERYLNDARMPCLSTRATAPSLAAQAGGMLAGEVVKLVALGLPPTLAGRVLEVDGLTLESRFHPVLRVPDCPVCGEKKKPRANPTLPGLIAAAKQAPRGDLWTLRDRLVSNRTGVVRRLEPFVKDPTEPATPYVVRADIANHRFLSRRDDDGEVCSGKGLTLPTAGVSALGEAIERYSGAVHGPDEVLHARRSELGTAALDPRDLVLYAERQYPALPYAPYDDNRLGWVPARSLRYQQEVAVPALGVFMNYRAADDGEFLFPITSNGLATGPTLLDAVWGAAMEVLERDAFMIAWLNRFPARRFSARTHPDKEIVALAELYARRGVEIRLYRMPTDHEVAVFAGIALEVPGRGGPTAVFGLGAHPDPVLAAGKAVLEVCQVRPALRRRMRRPEAQDRVRQLMEDPHLVATLDDHSLAYAGREALARLGFWLEAPEEQFEWQPQPVTSTEVDLAGITAWLAANEGDLLYVNLTPADMESLGLYTARVVIPGFQPIDFGWKERRLGGARLYDLPVKLGLRATPAAWDDLNHDPHPLA